jgi:hypothetical protein
MKLLDSSLFDVVALNETHAASVPLDLAKHAKQCGYLRIVLPARKFNTAGRFVGGTIVFVRRTLALSSVIKDYYDWGE